MSHAPPRPIDILRIATVLLLTALPSCRPDTVTSPTVTGVSFAKGENGGGGPGPKVDATEPPAAPQDVTLDVRVRGSGFDEGSVATWTIDGVEQAEVQTNSTTFVSKDELVANITIQENAAVDLYDVEVTTSRGKKGIGADLFSVVKKGTPTFTTVALEPVDGSDNSLAWAVNDMGQIAGLSLVARGAYDDRPTRWDIDDVSRSVETRSLSEEPDWFASQPYGISDGGIVAGGAVQDGTSKMKAVWWDVDGSAHTFEPGSGANDVSSFGSGWIAVGRDDWTAVYWTEAGGPPVDFMPAQPGASSVANAVNSAGTIAGTSGQRAVVWHRDGGGSYGPPCVLEADAVANGISEPTAEGQAYVAGNTYSDPVGAVWLVDPGAGSECLVSVRRLDRPSELYDVSSDGDAVGRSGGEAPAILFTADGVFALPGLNNGGKGARWARGISSDGTWIVGSSDAPRNSGRGVLWIRER